MVSYTKEQAAGNVRWNIVAIAMRLFDLDLQGAMVWVGKYHCEKQAQFLSLRKQIPSFGFEADKALEEYVGLLGNWTRANYSWNYESKRYFGDAGLDVQQNRWVSLLPQVGQ